MAAPSGLAAQAIYGTEVTPGTAVAADQAIPLRTGPALPKLERLDDPGIRAGRMTIDSLDRHTGRLTVGGTVKHTVYNKGMETLFTQLFGGVVKTGSGPYVRTYTPTSLAADAMTAQFGYPGTNGTVIPITWTGVKFTSWELAWAENDFLVFTGDAVAMNYTKATSLVAASYPASMSGFTSVQVGTTVGGSAVKVKSGSIKCDMGLNAERYFAGSNTMDEPLEAGLRSYTIELDVELIDTTHFDRHIAGTKHAVVVTATAGSDTLVITANCDYDEAQSSIEGTGLLSNKLAFTCMNSTDAGAITAVMTNSVV